MMRRLCWFYTQRPKIEIGFGFIEQYPYPDTETCERNICQEPLHLIVFLSDGEKDS